MDLQIGDKVILIKDTFLVKAGTIGIVKDIKNVTYNHFLYKIILGKYIHAFPNNSLNEYFKKYEIEKDLNRLKFVFDTLEA